MQKDYTDITIILDRSGSMSAIADDVIGGLKQFVEDQKKLAGKILLNFCQFDDFYETLFIGRPIAEVKDLSLVPRGTTALLDAIGKTINTLGETYSKLSEDSRPEKVIVVIITDGMENASDEFNRDQIFNMIKHQRENYNWNFVFLAANQDAIQVGKLYGISGQSSMTYQHNSQGVKDSLRSLSVGVSAYHTNVTDGYTFTDSDRQKQQFPK